MSEVDEVLMTHSPLDVAATFSAATLPSTGATSIFVGTTRDNFEGKKVLKLEYEAYEPMAVKELKRLCEEIREKWDVAKIIIHHRLGEVEITQPSVIIAISAPHRKESLEAVNFGIERLKEKVPIWKKEKYEEGGEVWKENKECCWANKARKRRRIFVDDSKIQVQASKEEIDRRIQAFILIKQEEKNKLNCLEFCDRRMDTEYEGSARTVSKMYRKEGSKSHLRTSTVDNSQVSVPKQPPKSNMLECMISGPLDTRFREMEHKVFQDNNKPVHRDVYCRLKSLEDRILHLESLSPEYSPVLQKNAQVFAKNPRNFEQKKNGLTSALSISNHINKVGRQRCRREVVLASLPRLDQRIQLLKTKIKTNHIHKRN